MIAYLGKNYILFVYNQIDDLKKEAKRYNIEIGTNVTIGTDVIIGSNVRIDSNVIIGSSVRIGADSYIGSNVRIDSNVIIKPNVFINSNVTINHNVRIELNVTIGSNTRIRSGVAITSNVSGKVTKAIHFDNLYKYNNDIIFTDNDIYIRFGCFTRTLSEWEHDFWNNDGEFPEYSYQGQERLSAFNTIKQIIENERGQDGKCLSKKIK